MQRQGAGSPEARWLQEAVAARGAPPAAGGCSRSGSRSFSPGGRANTATCLRPRRLERKSSLPAAVAAAAAGKTWAGAAPAPLAFLPAAGARAHKAAAIVSPS